MLKDFLNLIYPDLCYCCSVSLKNGENQICVKCNIDLPKTYYWKFEKNPIALKFYGKVQLDFAFSFFHFVKGGNVQKLLHQLKYKNKPQIGFLLGRWFGHEIQSNDNLFFDIIVPVPMHIRKEMLRGYNQADPIARGMADSLNTNWYKDVLVKVDDTESQTKKGRFERFNNTKEVFRFNPKFNIKNKHILLIDDVVTTGSTLEACAKILIKNGAKVSIATLAHAK